MIDESNIVLSAIRRGEDSLPKLRAATGLEYAQLHPVLYKLEFDYRSIRRSETADGFDRYAVANESNGGNKGTHWSGETPIPPAAFVQSKLSLAAREISILQRDAPYCVGCRGLCLLNGTNEEGRIRWQCRPCNESFDGSTLMGRVSSFEEADRQLAEIVERGRAPRHEDLGPEEEAALEAMRSSDDGVEEIDDDEEIENWRIGMCRKCGEPAINKTGNICQKHKDIEDAVLEPCRKCGTPTPYGIRNRRMNHCQECYKDYIKRRREEEAATRQAESEGQKEICGCGRELPHGGRCSARREAPKKTNVRTRKLGGNISNPITSNGNNTDNARNVNIADNTDSVETPKEAMAKPAHNMRENMQMAQVQVVGGMRLHEDVQIRISEMRDWPAERISEFFDALSKVIEIPHRPLLPTKIKRAWSLDFEGEAGKDDSTVGLTYLYLVSMLHHNMEPHEKEAVWTLVQYLKRMEAYVEQEKAKS